MVAARKLKLLDRSKRAVIREIQRERGRNKLPLIPESADNATSFAPSS
jgi:hypothetical protein